MAMPWGGGRVPTTVGPLLRGFVEFNEGDPYSLGALTVPFLSAADLHFPVQEAPKCVLR